MDKQRRVPWRAGERSCSCGQACEDGGSRNPAQRQINAIYCFKCALMGKHLLLNCNSAYTISLFWKRLKPL